MSEWQPIAQYDALKKKPKHAVFWVKEKLNSEHSRYTLPERVSSERSNGYRTVTHYMTLEPPK